MRKKVAETLMIIGLLLWAITFSIGINLEDVKGGTAWGIFNRMKKDKAVILTVMGERNE